MSYIFPKRVLGSQDVLDPEDMNADIMPAVELLGGNLNEHNIRAGVCNEVYASAEGAATPLAPGALQTPYYVARQVNPSLPNRASDAHARPAYMGGGRGHYAAPYPIPMDNQWHQIGEDDVNGNQMLVTFNTGTGKLWINAILQFFWLPDIEPIGTLAREVGWLTGTDGYIEARETDGWIGERLGGNPWAGGWAASVRFAIRVDGRVIQETITGRTDKSHRESSFVPDHALFSERCFQGQGVESHSISPAAIAVRLGCIVDVGPGAHKVELVARTVHRDSKGSGGDAIVHPGLGRLLEPVFSVYNSQLLAVDIPEEPTTVADPPVPKVKSFKTEDDLSNQSMYTDRVEKIKDAYNDISVDNLSRGALNRAHLPSPVRFARSSYNNDDVTLTNEWMGFSNRVTTHPYKMPGVGLLPWSTTLTGADSFKSILNCPCYNYDPVPTPHTYLGAFGTQSDASVHAGKCFLVVMADIEVIEIDHGNTDNLNDVLACFGFGFNFVDPVSREPIEAGALWVPEISWSLYNNTNYNPAMGTAGLYSSNQSVPDRFNASVMLVLDMTDRRSGITMGPGRGDGGTFGSFGGLATRPPENNDGTPIEIGNIHLLGALTPRGVDAYTAGEISGTESATVKIGNRNMSVMLLRF